MANRAALDAEIDAWTVRHPAAELGRMLEAADVPATRAYTAADCAADEQFRHHGMVREVEDAQLGRMLHPGIVPLFPQDPGAIRWARPAVGAHNEEVSGGLLGLSGDELAALRKEGVC